MSRRKAGATTTPGNRSAALPFACAGAIFIAILLWLAGPAWPGVAHGLIVDGGIAAAWVLAAGGIGVVLLDAAGIQSRSRLLQFATAAALGLGVMSLATLALGLAGILGRFSAWGMIAVGLIAGIIRIRPMLKAETVEPQPRRAMDRWLWLLFLPVASIVLIAAFVPPGILWGDEPHGYDVLEYHLQIPREWYELGRIAPLEHNVFSYFPFNVEMHYLLAMHLKAGPWNGMYLAQLMHAGFMGLTIVALCGAAGIPAALVAAAAPWVTLLAPVAYNEAGMLLFGTLAIVWMIQPQRNWKHTALAGAMAGFACGVKPTAVPMLLLALPAASLILPQARFSTRLRDAGIFMLCGLLMYAPWLVRNAVWTGNPVFPEATAVFGDAPFTAQQAQRWTQAHSATASQRGAAPKLEALWTQIAGSWRYGFVLLPLGFAGAILRRDRISAMLVTILLLHALFWVAFTHLQSRFFVLSIPIAAILIGRVQFEGFRWAAVAGAVVGMGITLAELGPRVVQVNPSIGLEDLGLLVREFVLPPDAAPLVFESDRAILLAGDAQAFRYPIPMSRLRYRTVFDVDVKPGQPVVDAWVGPDIPQGAVILVDPNELRRFSATYFAISPFEGDADRTYLIMP